MRIVVTAGPTREALDPVRFISNRSSGKMGYALAAAAQELGEDVTLISGPVALTPPAGVKLIQITSADELYDAVHAHTADCDLLVMCAAVSDYKPARAAKEKLPKTTGAFALELVPTRDILVSLPRVRSYVVVGFAAETHDLVTNARAKLARKNCDAIVANDVSRGDSGMESDYNEVVIFTRDGDAKPIAHAEKKIIAREILKILRAFAEKSLTKKT